MCYNGIKYLIPSLVNLFPFRLNCVARTVQMTQFHSEVVLILIRGTPRSVLVIYVSSHCVVDLVIDIIELVVVVVVIVVAIAIAIVTGQRRLANRVGAFENSYLDLISADIYIYIYTHILALFQQRHGWMPVVIPHHTETITQHNHTQTC